MTTAVTGGALLAHHAVTAGIIDEMIDVTAGMIDEMIEATVEMIDEIGTIAGVIDTKCMGLLRQLLCHVAGINNPLNKLDKSSSFQICVNGTFNFSNTSLIYPHSLEI